MFVLLQQFSLPSSHEIYFSFYNVTEHDILLILVTSLRNIPIYIVYFLTNIFYVNNLMAGFIGLALSYGLSLNVFVVFAVQNWCFLENSITSVERLEQYMHIPGEAAEVIESQRPMHNWPMVGKVKICDLKVIQKNCKEVLLYTSTSS